MTHKGLKLAHDLAYQFTTGVHTMGSCARDGCPNSSRGCNFCQEHTQELLIEEIGMNIAVRLYWALQARQKVQFEIDDIFEELSE